MALPVEHGVECGHLIDTHGRHSQEIGHIVHNANARPSLILALTEIKKWDDCSLFVLRWIARNNILRALQILSIKFEGNLPDSVIYEAQEVSIRSYLGIVVRRISMLGCIVIVQKRDIPRLPTTNRASDLRESVVDTKRLCTTLRGSLVARETLESIIKT